MEPNKRKLLSGPKSPIDTTSAAIGPHDVTLHRSEGYIENPPNLVESISSEYHLTAEITNSQLTRRDLSLLLEVLNYQIVTFGANFSMSLALTELYLRLTQGRSVDEENDGKIRLTLSVSEILIGSLKNRDFSLYTGEYVEVSHTIRSLVRPYLMSKRTYGSRYRTWRPEKLIRIRAVPVSTLYERGSRKTERYSSYTKGYGESHGSTHKQKTKSSMELDGDQTRPDKEERNLILRMTDVVHQSANILWIKFRTLLEETK